MNYAVNEKRELTGCNAIEDGRPYELELFAK
jgi:hypothetical protein